MPLLETKALGDGEPDERRVFMDPAEGKSEQEYTSSIAMARNEIRYRIHAGDAVSRWFTLKSVPRPFVLSFEKKFTFPKYTERKPLELREETGDLTALSGTEVELTIHLDQPVTTAALHLVTETRTNDLDFLQAAEPTQWALTLPIIESGAFTVHVATAAGLDNKFRPGYSITAQPDLVPTIKLAEPKGEVTARPEDILQVTGEASDDVGLEKIEQLIKVNDKAWATNALQLAKAPGTNTTFKLDWDLLKLDAKPGDLVMTKFAAVDLKGSRAESRPVRLKVDSAIFEANRIAAIEQQRHWTTNLIVAAEKTIEFHEELPDDIEGFILPGKDAERRDKTTEALKALEASQMEWQKVQQQLPSIVREAHAGRETAGLGLMGRVALRMNADWLSRARLHLRPLEGILVDARVQAHAGHLPDVLKEVKTPADLLQVTANGWLSADEAALSLDLLDYISRAASNMHRLAETDRNADPKVWERLGRRQRSVAKELEVVLATLKPLASRMTGGEGDIIQHLHGQIDAANKSFGEKLKGAQDGQLLPAGRELESAVNDVATKLRPLVLDLAETVAEARIELETSVGTTAAAVERLQSAMEAREQAAKDYEKAKESGKEILKADAKRKVAGEVLNQHWIIARDMLRGRARLEEIGKAAHAMFVSDTAQAALAVERLRADVEDGQDIGKVVAKLDDISRAITKLEAAHELTVVETAIKSLAARERWEKKSTDANTLRPRDWQWLRQRLSVTPEQLVAVGLKDAGDLLEAVKGSRAVREVGREMSERKRNSGIFLIEKSPKKK
jgi:tetratricopeptide (TPR) repeat protein